MKLKVPLSAIFDDPLREAVYLDPEELLCIGSISTMDRDEASEFSRPSDPS